LFFIFPQKAKEGSVFKHFYKKEYFKKLQKYKNTDCLEKI